MYIAELDFTFELKDEELVEVDECEYEIHSDLLQRELEELVHWPILGMCLFLNGDTNNIGLRIDNVLADPDLCEDWLFFRCA